MRVRRLKRRKTPVIRATNVPGTGIGRKRHDLYANAFDQINKARAAGFYIECIAILESIISDRLEARRACLNPNDLEKHRFWTLRTASKLLSEERSDDPGIRQLYQRILDWSQSRDRAIHEMAKLGAVEQTEVWAERNGALIGTVDEGIDLARRLDRKVQALNRKDYEKHTKASLHQSDG